MCYSIAFLFFFCLWCILWVLTPLNLLFLSCVPKYFNCTLLIFANISRKFTFFLKLPYFILCPYFLELLVKPYLKCFNSFLYLWSRRFTLNNITRRKTEFALQYGFPLKRKRILCISWFRKMKRKGIMWFIYKVCSKSIETSWIYQDRNEQLIFFLFFTQIDHFILNMLILAYFQFIKLTHINIITWLHKFLSCAHSFIRILAHSAGATEYSNCFSAEG